MCEYKNFGFINRQKRDNPMEEQLEKKYEFYLEINALRDHELYLTKAGENRYNDLENKNPGEKQNFEECWGFKNASIEQKHFDAWKEKFFPTLLDKYNIDIADCKVKVKGPIEVFNFFDKEEYSCVIEKDGEPIELLKDEDIEKILCLGEKLEFERSDDDSRNAYKKLIDEVEQSYNTYDKEFKNLEEQLNANEKDITNINEEIRKNDNIIDELQKEKGEMLQQLDTYLSKENIEKALIPQREYKEEYETKEEIKKIVFDYYNTKKIKKQIKNLIIKTEIKNCCNEYIEEIDKEIEKIAEDAITRRDIPGRKGLFQKTTRTIGYKYKFDVDKFSEYVKNLLQGNNIKTRIEDFYQIKIKEQENDKSENEKKIENLNQENTNFKKNISILQEKLKKLNYFLDENKKLRNSNKEKTEEEKDDTDE